MLNRILVGMHKFTLILVNQFRTSDLRSLYIIIPTASTVVRTTKLVLIRCRKHKRHLVRSLTNYIYVLYVYINHLQYATIYHLYRSIIVINYDLTLI